MNRLVALALLAVCPAAYAQQDDYVAGQKLAEAFSQADLDALGRCQARVEGGILLHDEFVGWLDANTQLDAAKAARAVKEKGGPLAQTLSSVRRTAAQGKGLNLAASDREHATMLETFKRHPGEDERAAYLRWQPQTMLTPDCAPAMERARWKIEVDKLPEVQ
ncbi:MAG: hypothetical protein Q8R82_06175 [Hyphomonadaceae bacterium]|nr:hypothetical protein [Hyphomonadaceae bacterium]